MKNSKLDKKLIFSFKFPKIEVAFRKISTFRALF